MSSSLANMMTALALEVSSRRLMILSNSPGLGSLGIFKDWAMHTPPWISNKQKKKRKRKLAFFIFFIFLLFLFFNDLICDCNNLDIGQLSETLPSSLWRVWKGTCLCISLSLSFFFCFTPPSYINTDKTSSRDRNNRKLKQRLKQNKKKKKTVQTRIDYKGPKSAVQTRFTSRVANFPKKLNFCTKTLELSLHTVSRCFQASRATLFSAWSKRALSWRVS